MGISKQFDSGVCGLDCGSLDHDHRLRHRGRVGQGCDQRSRMDPRQNERRQEMKGFILGTVFGIMICTVGFGGIARMLDTGVNKVQEISKEAAK